MFIFDTNISIYQIQSKHFLFFLSLLIYFKGLDETNYFIITIIIIIARVFKTSYREKGAKTTEKRNSEKNKTLTSKFLFF
jgi:hypothetical protein